MPELRKEVGKRLTQTIAELGLKRPRFAEILGFKYDLILAYEKGRAEPGTKFFRKLIKHFPSVDVGWILTGEKTSVEKPVGALPVRSVPIVHAIPAGGFVAGIPDENIRGTVFSTDLKTLGLFALDVKGHSMEPEIHEGDVAIFAPDMDFRNGDIYAVVAKESEATLKRVFKTAGGWTLVPINNEYESQFVPDDKMIRLYKLMEVVRRFNHRKQSP